MAVLDLLPRLAELKGDGAIAEYVFGAASCVDSEADDFRVRSAVALAGGCVARGR